MLPSRLNYETPVLCELVLFLKSQILKIIFYLLKNGLLRCFFDTLDIYVILIRFNFLKNCMCLCLCVCKKIYSSSTYQFLFFVGNNSKTNKPKFYIVKIPLDDEIMC